MPSNKKHIGKRRDKNQRVHPLGGNRRSKKGLKRHGTAEALSTTTADEIEQQLLLQREQRRQQNHSQQQQKAPDSTCVSPKQKPKRLGDYVFDEERDAYFPVSLHDDHRQKASNATASRSYPLSRKRSFPFLPFRIETPDLRVGRDSALFRRRDYAYLIQLCASPWQRESLLSEWKGGAVLQKLTAEEWSDHHRISGLDDTGSPPWCRTFDVLEQEALFPNFLHLTGGMAFLNSYPQSDSSLPRANNLNDFSRNQNPFPSCENYYAIRFLSGHSPNENFAVALERASVMEVKSFLISVAVGVSTPNIYGTALPVEANDVIRLPISKNIVIATNYDQVYRGRPWIGGSIASLDNFPTSDSLCVEALQSKDTVLFGHRNGQVTLYDHRSRRCTSTRPCSRLGNISSLYPLPDSSPQFLARGAHGLCRLCDTRQLTSSAQRDNSPDPSIVQDFNVPWSGQNHWTNQCRGVVTDPTGTVVLFPWIDQTVDTSTTVVQQPQLGTWSLHSGRFLGCKPVGASVVVVSANSTSSNQQRNHATRLELCPTLTRAWDLPTSITEASRPINGSCGYWMRSWSRTESRMFFVAIEDKQFLV